MGNRGAACGDEYDAFSRVWRKLVHWRVGEVAKIKRRFRKRVRLQSRREDRARATDA